MQIKVKTINLLKLFYLIQFKNHLVKNHKTNFKKKHLVLVKFKLKFFINFILLLIDVDFMRNNNFIY